MKPSAAQLYSIRAKGGEIGINLNLPVVEWKEWKPSEDVLRAWARASNPFARSPGDGRGPQET